MPPSRLRQPAHAVPNTWHLGEHLLVPAHPGQNDQAAALPGELRPGPKVGCPRVLLLPGDDVEGLVQVTGVAQRIGQMPGDHPGQRVVGCGVGAAEAVLQQAAGFGVIRWLRDERQCRARRRGSGEPGDLPQLGQVAVFAARRQGAIAYRLA